jgi:hypothetical protein
MVHHFSCQPRWLRWKNTTVSTVDHTNTGELTAPTNGDHVSTVDHTNTGELTAPTNGDHISTVDHVSALKNANFEDTSIQDLLNVISNLL